MKIGDKVRFLSETGGGIIKGFQGKDIVLVEDSDGFDIPVTTREVVVIDTDDYNMSKPEAKYNQPLMTKKKSEAKTSSNIEKKDEEEIEISEQVVELSGGDRLNVSLAFVPDDIRMINSTSFDAYIINDSNYFLSYIYLSGENNSWRLRSQGVVAPNMKMWVESFMQSSLGEMEHVCLQLLTFKKNKPFELHATTDVQPRIDCTKFYKVHCFVESDFFDKPALIYPIVKDNVPVRPLNIEVKELEKEMMCKKHVDEQHPSRIIKKTSKTDFPVIDLHVDSLLDTTAGMSHADILKYQINIFHQEMEKIKLCHGQKIVFIHGKGDGVLRKAVLDELRRSYNHQCTWQDASFQEYGFGATEIRIK